MEPDERRRHMERGRRHFEAGEFYEAHEEWEAVWDELDDPERRWVQGMIQVATGLHKLAAGRPDVCWTLLGKAVAKLDGAVATDGVDLARLRDAAAALRAAIDRGERPDPRALRLHDAK